MISYNSLKKRRDYEIEGFTNDILMLRKQLKILEKNILKYGPLEDKELQLLNLGISFDGNQTYSSSYNRRKSRKDIYGITKSQGTLHFSLIQAHQ